jgi:hypothetical protein
MGSFDLAKSLMRAAPRWTQAASLFDELCRSLA